MSRTTYILIKLHAHSILANFIEYAIINFLIDEHFATGVITDPRTDTNVPGTIGHNSMGCNTLTITLASFLADNRIREKAAW